MNKFTIETHRNKKLGQIDTICEMTTKPRKRGIATLSGNNSYLCELI